MKYLLLMILFISCVSAQITYDNPILNPSNPSSPLYNSYVQDESFGTKLILTDPNNINISWSVHTDGNGNEYRLSIPPGRIKEKILVYENLGYQQIHLQTKCEGELCQYLSLSSRNIVVDSGLGMYDLNTILIDFSESDVGNYQANIITTDNNGNSIIISVSTTIGEVGLLAKTFLKFFSLKDFNGFKFPYAAFFFASFLPVFFLFNYFLRKLSAGTALALMIASLVGLLTIILIN